MADPTIANQDRFAHIGPFRDLVDANLAIGRLEEAGIDAHLAGENVAAMLGPIYGAAYAGGPMVLVSPADEGRANGIIAEVENVRRERMAAESPACPNCGHHATTRTTAAIRWAGVIALAAGVGLSGFPPYGLVLFVAAIVMFVWPVLPFWRCANCGHGFSAPIPNIADAHSED